MPWPGVAIPEPDVATFQITNVSAPWLELRPTSAAFQLPENASEHAIYDVDARSTTDLVELVAHLGGDLVPVRRVRWRDTISPHRGPLPLDQHDQYAQLVSNWSEALGFPAVTREELFEVNPEQPDIVRVHLAEIAARVWSLQAITRGLAGTARVSDTPYGVTAFPDPAEIVSASWLAGQLSLFLTPFAPRLDLEPLVDKADAHVIVERVGWPPTALEVAALQLFNSIVREDQFRPCAKCKRPFTTQVGRADFTRDESHRRRDAIYCSERCQKAATAKRRRDRDRAARTATATPGRSDRRPKTPA